MNKEYKLKNTDSLPLEEQVSKIWSRNLSKLPVYKDLPRLAGRITIGSNVKTINKKRASLKSQVNTTSTGTSADDKVNKKRSKCLSLKLSQYFDEGDKQEIDKLEVQADDNNDTKVWKRVKSTIYQLSEMFDSPEQTMKLESLFESQKQPSEYELTLESLFKQSFPASDGASINESNKIVKILKLVHQNIIYIGCFEIKVKVPFLMTHMTKDVRGPEGWRINIFESKDTYTVTHCRQEESLATAPADKQFKFEWQLHITSNKDLTEITSVTLKIVNLTFKDTTSSQFKEEINRQLCSGNLFIY